MNKQNVEDLYPLSPLQQGMLFHTLLAPESGAYVEQITYEMVGWLRTDLYRRVWQEALERHPVLRTAFFWEKLPKPLQVVHRRLKLPVHEEDLRAMPEGERQAHVDAFVESDRLRGFDMAQAPLLRLALFRTGEDGWTGVLSFHHILLDGWSMPIVFQEAHFAYEALVQGQRAEIPRPRPFRDYIGWLGKQDLAQAEAFWRRALAGFAEPSTPRFAPPAVPIPGYHKAQARVEPAVGAALQGLARRHKVTLNTVVQAAWALLLSRYSGTDDVVFGATVSGRPAELDGVERMVGMFINSLPLRARAEARLTVGEWVERLQAFSTEARQFEHAPLVEVQGWSDVPRDRPLFETLYVFENMPLRPRTDHQGLAEGGEAEAPATGQGSMRMVTAKSPERTNFPLLLVIAPEGDELALRLTVDTARYDAAVGERMLAHLVAVLGEFASRPGVRLGEVGMMAAGEARRLDELGRGPVDAAPDECLHHLWEAQAGRTPHAVALRHEGTRVTYAELEARANRLARHLSDVGVRPGATVGVCLERTPEMIVALLAVLKAGAAYVPLDPAYPAERLEFMLADSAAAAVVTDAAAAARMAAGAARVVRVDADAEAIAGQGAERMECAVTPRDLAYVIFTSGSTGRPKGVMIEHRSSARIVRWVGAEHTDAERACVLGSTSISFDVSIAEIFGTLCFGGTLLLVENALSLASLDESAGVTTVVMVPTAAAELLRMGGIPRTVRTMDLAGEPLPNALAQRLYATGHVQVVRNLYGPTEDTTYSTLSLVEEGGGRVYIGRPVSNTRALVLDDAYRPVPLGIPGELYLAGDGVTRGYLGRPGLTAERYLPDPSGPAGARMYRVMDRVRWSEGGELEYIERVDHQVKIRGYRVELGEIEAALAEHPGVGECAVTAFGEGDAPRELVAYWVPAAVDAPSVAELRGHLKGRLPGYMVPPYFVVLRELPRTPNGKVDRRALPAPHGAGRAAGEYVPPRNATETALAAIWREVLGVERVGAHDSFFDLGGHSLKATQVVSRVRETMGTALPIRAVFEAPTLAELALRCGAGGAEADAAIVRVADEGGVPLSFAQERLWFLDRMEPGGSTYNIPFALRVDGALDTDALERAMAEVVRRHDQLRASFREVDGRPVQVFAPAGEFRLRVEDLSHLPAAEREAETERRVHADAVRPFDLARGPLFRAALLRLSAGDHVLSLNFHHAVSDGWSFGVFFREVTQLYAAFAAGHASPLPELEVQYADYAAWQRAELSGEALAEDVEFWRAALAGAPPLLELPTDRPRPAVQGFRGATLSVAYPAELSERLEALARAHGASLFQALMAAFHALVARYSGQDDVVVGTPLAGRTRPETEALIGFFINTLPVRGDLSGDPTFRELLARTREATLGVYAHQELPFEKLVEELQPERSLAYGPYFQVLFGLQNRGMGGLRLGDLAVQQVPVGATDSKLDLGFSLADTEGGLAGSIEYNPDLFDADTIRRMSARYVRLLQAVAADPDARVLRVPLAEADELAAVTREWNRTVAPVAEACVHELFEAGVRRWPHAVALQLAAREVTYAELDVQANRLANHLRTLGVGPDTVVAISLQRSPEMIVALLAVLKAGGAYLPVDPAYPAERREHMLSDSGAVAIVTTSQLAAHLPAHSAAVVALDVQSAALAAQSPEPPVPGVAADNLAYVIYTSGSTGLPKGVMVPHRGVVNMAAALIEGFGYDVHSRVLQFASFSFDAGSAEILCALLSGARLHLAPAEDLYAGDPLVRTLRAGRISVATLPPTVLALLPEDGLPELRSLISTGEACNADLARRWAPGRRFVNAYGPTETTVGATFAVVPHGSGSPSIGRPWANVRVYVLAGAVDAQPVGMPGEMCVGGVGVTRGYLRRPALTAEKFVPDPFSPTPGGRMYRTGDKGRWLGDGTLEFMGRIDQQVKIRGFRIELGEVESAFASNPDVAQAVVVVRSDAGDRRLVAYVVPREGVRVDADEVRAHAARVLPEFMVPAAVVVLAALPLMPNGKVDRGALPTPAGLAGSTDHFVEPRTPTERALAAIYADLLSARKVGAGDDFFSLGGHSLLATRLVSRIRAELGAEIALRTVFQSPTVAALAALVDAAAGPRAARDVPLAGAGPEQDAPLSFAQERLWFLDQMEPGSATYNLPITLRLRGALDVDALRRSLGEIARRHEVLRAVFRDREGRPVQRFGPADAFVLPVDDVSRLSTEALEREIGERVCDESLAPFSLAEGPLFRAELLRAGPADHVLLVNMHHAVSDGWSVGILVRELTALYAAFSAGQPSPLPELPVRYADFAAWQRGWLTGEVLAEQVAFWRRTLADAPALLELPTDRPRPAVQTYRGANFDIAFPGGLLQPLSALARAEGASVFMALMGAFQVLMARYSGQDDVVVGTPIAGRNRAELEGLIGFFVNTLPIRGDLAGDPTFRQLLRRVREATLDAYAHQDLPFEKLVAEIHPERSLSHGPIFQVMFTLQNLPPGGLALGDVAIEQVAGQEVAAKYDLAFTLAESAAGLGGSIQYNPDLFDTATIERMAAHFGRLLSAFAADPDARVWRVPLMDAAERTRVVQTWNATAAPFPAAGCAHELFAEQAVRTPRACAVEGGGTRLSYAELDAAANRLAHALRARGVGPEVPVAVSLDRSPEMVVALLAVLKAGGAYLPLDPAYPLDRRAFMLRDSGTRVVISRPELAGDVAGEGIELVTPDAAFDPSLRASPPAALGTPDNLAYVTYTSGSTGLPKGVMVPHRGVANLVQAQVKAFELRAGTRVLQFASLSFDAAASETFTTLLSGGTLVLASREALLPGDPLLGTLAGQRVEVITLPPSVLATLPPEALPALRTVVSAGEACTADVARRWSGPLVPADPTSAAGGVALPRLELRDPAPGTVADGDAEMDSDLAAGSPEADDAVPAGHSG